MKKMMNINASNGEVSSFVKGCALSRLVSMEHVTSIEEFDIGHRDSHHIEFHLISIYCLYNRLYRV